MSEQSKAKARPVAAALGKTRQQECSQSESAVLAPGTPRQQEGCESGSVVPAPGTPRQPDRRESTRVAKHRYRHQNKNSGAAFIELDCRMTREEFVERLHGGRGTRDIQDCKSEFDQNNPGNTEMRQDLDYGVTGHY